jgi:hypothetical protein
MKIIKVVFKKRPLSRAYKLLCLITSHFSQYFYKYSKSNFNFFNKIHISAIWTQKQNSSGTFCTALILQKPRIFLDTVFTLLKIILSYCSYILCMKNGFGYLKNSKWYTVYGVLTKILKKPTTNTVYCTVCVLIEK